MSTVSLITLFQQIRAHILAYEHPNGSTVGDTLGTEAQGRLYYVAAPDNVNTPYAVGRLVNIGGSLGGVRLRADLEIMIYDRPRARQLAAENLADLIQGALIGLRQATSGLVFTCGAITRDSLPPAPSPGDASLVQVRLMTEVIAYPEFLTQYAVPANS